MPVSVTRQLTQQNYSDEVKRVVAEMQQDREQRFLYHWGLARCQADEVERLYQFFLHANSQREKSLAFWW